MKKIKITTCILIMKSLIEEEAGRLIKDGRSFDGFISLGLVVTTAYSIMSRVDIEIW